MLSINQLKTNISAGVYDKEFSRVYCRPTSEIAPYYNRVLKVAEGYKDVFKKDDSSSVAICSAPGRTELGGNHTDHQRGKVLTGAVDLDAIACVAVNGSNIVNIYSEGYGMTSVDCSDLSVVESEKNSTKAIVRGVLAKIASLGYAVSGFDAYVISDVPGGSGLSSSACFEVLVGTIVNCLYCGNSINSAEIAKIGQYAENIYFGKPSGLLDQMGCSIGGVVAIDFKDKENPEYHAVDYDFAAAGYALCIIDTGADHKDLTDDYSAIPYEMKAVAACFGKEVLCEVDEDEFYNFVPAIREKVGDRAIMRAIHYYTDCHRVEKQVEALEKNDIDEYLRLVTSSGHSSYMFLQNVDTYRNPAFQAVGLAIAMAGHHLKGRGARRVHGGGFAGTIQAYVPLDMVDEFKAGMDALMGDGACRVTYLRPVGGCTLCE